MTGSYRKMEDGSDKCGDSEHVSDSSTSSETCRSSSFSSEASNEYSKRTKRRKKRKHVEDWWDSSDTCDTIETKKRKKNQVTKRKIVRKKRKTKKHRKSRNESRIPVHFSLTSSCAALNGKVLEACGLSCRKNVQFFYLHNDLKAQLCETTWAAFIHFCVKQTLVLPFSGKSQAKAYLQPRCHQGLLVDHKSN